MINLQNMYNFLKKAHDIFWSSTRTLVCCDQGSIAHVLLLWQQQQPLLSVVGVICNTDYTETVSQYNTDYNMVSVNRFTESFERRTVC